MSELLDVSNITMLVMLVVVVILLAWYSAANRTWYRIVRKREATIHIDPVAQPSMWLRTAYSRLRRGLTMLGTPSDDEDLELWRIRTLRRLVASFGLGSLVLVLTPLTVQIFSALIATDARRGGRLALGGALVVGIILAYYSYRLVRAVYRFGNAEALSRTEIIIGLLGIFAALGGAVFFVVIPVGPLS
jgi:hypothetical protein